MKYNGSYRKREREKHIFGEEVLYEEKTLLRHNRISALRIVILLTGFLIALILLAVVLRNVFSLKTVSVTGSERYTAEEIASNCGVSAGDFMFSFPSSRIKERILECYPYVESVEVKRIYPSEVSVRVTEYKRGYYFYQLGKYVYIAPDLKVLEVADSCLWEDNSVMLMLPSVSRAIVGRKLEFSSIERDEYIKGVINSLENVSIEQRIDAIDLTDYFNIKMTCENRYFITFGKYVESEMSLKIKTLNEIMGSERIKSAQAATVDISELKQQSVVPYDRVEDIR